MIIYLVLLLTVGFPLLLGEISLGRKSGKAAIEAYRACDNGIFLALSPVFLLCFYCSFGAYVIKYFTANLGDLLGLFFGVGEWIVEHFFLTLSQVV